MWRKSKSGEEEVKAKKKWRSFISFCNSACCSGQVLRMRAHVKIHPLHNLMTGKLLRCKASDFSQKGKHQSNTSVGNNNRNRPSASGFGQRTSESNGTLQNFWQEDNPWKQRCPNSAYNTTCLKSHHKRMLYYKRKGNRVNGYMYY